MHLKRTTSNDLHVQRRLRWMPKTPHASAESSHAQTTRQAGSHPTEQRGRMVP